MNIVRAYMPINNIQMCMCFTLKRIHHSMKTEAYIVDGETCQSTLVDSLVTLNVTTTDICGRVKCRMYRVYVCIHCV